MTKYFDIIISPKEFDTSTNLKPINVVNVSEQVANTIITAITLGEFIPGQKLPTITEMSKILKVSRLSIHEALQILASKKYIEINRGRNGGAVVINNWRPETVDSLSQVLVPNWKYFEYLFDLRQMIEPMIAAKAAKNCKQNDRKNLIEAVDEYINANNDREKSRAADQKLHAKIAAITHNPYLIELSLQIRFRLSFGFQAEPYSEDIRKKAVRQHKELVDSIIQNECEKAKKLSEKHFLLTENAIRELYEKVKKKAE